MASASASSPAPRLTKFEASLILNFDEPRPTTSLSVDLGTGLSSEHSLLLSLGGSEELLVSAARPAPEDPLHNLFSDLSLSRAMPAPQDGALPLGVINPTWSAAPPEDDSGSGPGGALQNAQHIYYLDRFNAQLRMIVVFSSARQDMPASPRAANPSPPLAPMAEPVTPPPGPDPLQEAEALRQAAATPDPQPADMEAPTASEVNANATGGGPSVAGAPRPPSPSPSIASTRSASSSLVAISSSGSSSRLIGPAAEEAADPSEAGGRAGRRPPRGPVITLAPEPALGPGVSPVQFGILGPLNWRHRYEHGFVPVVAAPGPRAGPPASESASTPSPTGAPVAGPLAPPRQSMVLTPGPDPDLAAADDAPIPRVGAGSRVAGQFLTGSDVSSLEAVRASRSGGIFDIDRRMLLSQNGNSRASTILTPTLAGPTHSRPHSTMVMASGPPPIPPRSTGPRARASTLQTDATGGGAAGHHGPPTPNPSTMSAVASPPPVHLPRATSASVLGQPSPGLQVDTTLGAGPAAGPGSAAAAAAAIAASPTGSAPRPRRPVTFRQLIAPRASQFASGGAPRREMPWIVRQMFSQEESFTDLRTLRLFAGTWNVNGRLPNEDLSAWLQSDLGLADIVVLGFQELDLSASAFLLDNSAREDDWTRIIEAGFGPRQHRYRKVASKQLVGMLVVVYVLDRHVAHVRDITTGAVGTGIMNMMGNKGGVAVRMRIYDSYVTFINSHLAAATNEIERRNSDFRQIESRMQFAYDVYDAAYTHLHPAARAFAAGLSFGTAMALVGPPGAPLDGSPARLAAAIPTPGANPWDPPVPPTGIPPVDTVTFGLYDSDYVFWVGDLNYRLTLPGEQVRAMVPDRRWSELMVHDQLLQEQARGRTFNGFIEPPVHFGPTYKFDPGTDTFDTSEKRRAPAWCDRVLYARSDSVVPVAYRYHRTLLTSDHKPVSAEFDLTAIKVYNPLRARRTEREVMHMLDRFENDAIPDCRLSGIAAVFAGAQLAPLAREPLRTTLQLSNTGRVLASWRFIPKVDESAWCPTWLTIEPMSGQLTPGETVSITFEASLGGGRGLAEVHCPAGADYWDFVASGGSGPEPFGVNRLEDILILHLENGRDLFITVEVDLAPSAFGVPLPLANRLPAPPTGLAFPLRPESLSADRAPVPQVLARLADFLLEHGQAEPGLFLSTAGAAEVARVREVLEGTGGPLAGALIAADEASLLPGGDGGQGELAGPGVGAAANGTVSSALLHAAATVFVRYLEALPVPVVPPLHMPRCLALVQPDPAAAQLTAAAAAAAAAAADPDAPAPTIESLIVLQPDRPTLELFRNLSEQVAAWPEVEHGVLFCFVMDVLCRLLMQCHRNSLTVAQLAGIFGPILFRPGPAVPGGRSQSVAGPWLRSIHLTKHFLEGTLRAMIIKQRHRSSLASPGLPPPSSGFEISRPNSFSSPSLASASGSSTGTGTGTGTSSSPAMDGQSR
ncbi:hypothetical protein H696_04315 [Fonticula alba]|uniref:Rho-GAP domain-containing protein n=1 Tax=Fonticula alba TaxID=691883 RepID=A0A058Z435_FONAL|nr:hypothetical protein H696_04315 [Fonticula alba]KCV68896.1 hypothetical protein H696_04315 [Fonticula alba]|eukprot:XP_009496467.1 hypothetical protein H696_04315 [Fonticula alba]